MKYILDTHSLLWITSYSSNLGTKAKTIYLDERNEIYISKASIWEMAIKISLKKLHIKNDLQSYITNHVIANGIKILDITLNQIYIIESLSFHHRDPFDRLIIAQVFSEGFQLISSDNIFDKYNIKRIWE